MVDLFAIFHTVGLRRFRPREKRHFAPEMGVKGQKSKKWNHRFFLTPKTSLHRKFQLPSSKNLGGDRILVFLRYRRFCEIFLCLSYYNAQKCMLLIFYLNDILFFSKKYKKGLN